MISPTATATNSALEKDKIGSVSTEIDEPTLAITRGLYAVWKNAATEDGLPKWKAFSASNIKELMPHVYALDIIDGGADFRVRFMGSAITQSIGDDFTGKLVSENPSHPSTWRADIYREVIARRTPMFTAVDLGDFGRDFVKTECVLLPVADNTGELSMIVCAAAVY